jgi:hypothetical protein
MSGQPAVDREEELTNTPLRDASRDIRSARRRFARKQFERWRVISPLRLIDQMLEDLEQMNLRGARRVPLSWQPQLALLNANLPPGVYVDPAEVRAGISPTRLMEGLFGLQDQLLDLKIGPLRATFSQESN